MSRCGRTPNRCKRRFLLSNAEAAAALANVRRVRTEAAEMRRTGELLERVRRVRCPVLALHGDWDPHPASGVEEPLSHVLEQFRFILLPRGGHIPWRERHARDAFYNVLKQELAGLKAVS